MSVEEGIWVLKADGSREPFDESKLAESLRKSGADESVVREVLLHISREVVKGMSTSDIYRHAMIVLSKVRHPIAARYSLRRAIAGFGPSGFPFERYVAEVWKAQGFRTEVGRILSGKCVEHEVDVVAFRGDEVIVIEAKFHNEYGYKSDVKVALYVKSRFDDLMGRGVEVDGQMKKVTAGILITNTKFSELAVRYGLCAGLHMIGWSYPSRGNLESLIEESKLHPVSCLTTISEREKRLLFDKGVVLCKSLEDDATIADLRLSRNKEIKLRDEIKMLCAAG